MKKTVDNIPFLRLTAAVIAGIVLGKFLPASIYLIFCLLVLLTVTLLWLNVNYSYHRTAFFGLGVHLFFIATGFLLFNRFNQKPEFFSNGKFIAVVKEILQEKDNSYQSALKIHTFIKNDSELPTDEKVLVYFAKDDKSKALLPGQIIYFTSSPQEIKNSDNRFEFDYKKYMEKRKIYRQVYLPADQWRLSFKVAPFSISLLAERVRLKLLNVYNQQNWNSRQLNVLSALTLGYRRALSPETKKTFASAGAMHILAVSGLHTGILFLFLTHMFGFLKKKKTGRLLFIVVVVLILWGFAFLTGLSPSVMRAAAMFSFVVIGQNLRRQVNIYNTLAASAFLLLLLNPNNLFEAGFQLSYSAVFGIVFLQPRIEKIIHFRLKVFRYFWRLLTVSVAAQIATFPVSVFYFNQFPVYFWVSNLFLIPAVTVLIPLGIVLLIVSWHSLLSELLAGITGGILNGLLNFLELVEQLPHSVIYVHFSEVELLFLLAALLSSFFFIGFRNKIYFKSVLIFILLFSGSSLIRQGVGLFRSEIIMYYNAGQNVVHFISGKRNYIVSEQVLKETDRVHNLIHNTVTGLHLHRPHYLTSSQLFNDSVLYINKGFILFRGQVVHFYDGKQASISPFNPDVQIGLPTL